MITQWHSRSGWKRKLFISLLGLLEGRPEVGTSSEVSRYSRWCHSPVVQRSSPAWLEGPRCWSCPCTSPPAPPRTCWGWWRTWSSCGAWCWPASWLWRWFSVSPDTWRCCSHTVARPAGSVRLLLFIVTPSSSWTSPHLSAHVPQFWRGNIEHSQDNIESLILHRRGGGRHEILLLYRLWGLLNDSSKLLYKSPQITVFTTFGKMCQKASKLNPDSNLK